MNPGEALPFSLDLNEKMLKPGKEYHLNIQALTNLATPMVPYGHVVATEQFALTPPPGTEKSRGEFSGAGTDQVSIDEQAEKVVISFADGEIVFDRKSGYLESYVMGGLPLLSSGPEPNFWRAPTENDFGSKMPERCAIWKPFGKELVLQSLIPVQTVNTAMLLAEYIHPENGSNYRLTYFFNNEGEIMIGCGV